MLLLVLLFFSLVSEAAQLYAKALIGRTTDEIFGDFGRVWRELARESQIRWVCRTIPAIMTFSFS